MSAKIANAKCIAGTACLVVGTALFFAGFQFMDVVYRKSVTLIVTGDFTVTTIGVKHVCYTGDLKPGGDKGCLDLPDHDPGCAIDHYKTGIELYQILALVAPLAGLAAVAGSAWCCWRPMQLPRTMLTATSAVAVLAALGFLAAFYHVWDNCEAGKFADSLPPASFEVTGEVGGSAIVIVIGLMVNALGAWLTYGGVTWTMVESHKTLDDNPTLVGVGAESDEAECEGVDYGALTHGELQKRLKALGCPTTGIKKELLDRLVAAELAAAGATDSDESAPPADDSDSTASESD